MPWQQSPFVVPLVITAVVAGTVGAYALRQRSAPGARPFTVLMWAIALWSLCYALALGSLGLSAKVLWEKMAYLGVVTMPAAWLLFVQEYTQQEWLLRGRRRAWLVVEPVVTLILLATTARHGLVWSRMYLQPHYAQMPILLVDHGPWFWVHTVYSYVLMALGLLLLLRTLSRPSRLYRRQALTLLVGMLLPWVGNFLLITGLNPIAPIDPQPFLATIAGGIVAWGLLHFRLFDVVPVARAAVMEAMDSALFVLDVHNHVVDVNAAAQHLLGRKPAQVIGHPAGEVLAGCGALAGAGTLPAQSREEVWWDTAVGRRCFAATASPLRDARGEGVGRLLALHDVTELKNVEAEVRRRNEELATLYDVALELIAQHDVRQLLGLIVQRATDLMDGVSGGLYLYRPENDDLEFVVGYKMSEPFVGITLRRGEGLSGKVLDTGQPLIVDDYGQWPDRAPSWANVALGGVAAVPLRWGQSILGVINVSRPMEAPFTAADIRLLTLFANQAAAALESIQLYEALQRELVERKQTAEALRNRSEELAALQATALDIVAAHELPALLQAIVERATRLLHTRGGGLYLCDAERREVKCVVSYNTPRDYTGVVLKYGEGAAGTAAESGQPVLVDDYRTWEGRADVFEGDQPFRAVLSVPMIWQGQVVGVLHVLEEAQARHFDSADLELLSMFANYAAIAVENARLYERMQRELAERERVEMDLRRSEARYRGVVEDQTELISRFSPDWNLTFVNDATCRFAAKKREELLGQSIMADVPPEDQPRVSQTIASISREHPVVTVENRVIRADGQLRWYQWTDRGIFGADGRVVEYQSVGRDISERRRAEEERAGLETQLRQAQRMEAIGLLAGGVAHEFNNLLTVILGNVELTLSDVELAEPLRRVFNTIQRTAVRAAALTRQLLAFSRRQVLHQDSLDLNAVISGFTDMLKRVVERNIDLHIELAPSVQPVFGDGAALEQVLMNLVLNGRDAMPGGGVLTIRTADATLGEAFSRTHPDAHPGPYVRLSVTDTGEGMDEEALSRVFQPFFTTKEIGKGTGLGLSVIYGIVKGHGGVIDVESQVGHGTRFDLYFPAHQQQGEKAAPAPSGPARGGTETILVVEDEPAVRELAQTSLRSLGYTVLLATDGREAVNIFAANQKRIDLLVIDAVMPRMSGKEACTEIVKLRPGLPVLFITGYAADAVDLRTGCGERAAVLQKPFALSELAEKVRGVLDRQSLDQGKRSGGP